MDTGSHDIVAPRTTTELPRPNGAEQPKRRRYAGVGPNGQDIDWADWMRSLGRQIRRTREFLRLSQETLAQAAGISQGAMSRLEAGRGIGTPLVVVLRVQLVLTGLLRDVDPLLLADDVRRFADIAKALSLPLGKIGVDAMQLTRDATLEELVRTHNKLSERARRKLLAVVRATAGTLGDDKE